MTRLLKAKLAAVRRRLATLDAAAGAARIVAVVILLLAGGMLLDWFIDLPRWMRAGLLLFYAAAGGFILIHSVVRPLLFGPDEDEIALMVERAMPDLASRLISSVQLSRPRAIPAGASVSLVRALLVQTEEIVRPRDLRQVVRADRLARSGGLALGALLAGLLAMSAGGDVTSDLLKRAMLVPGIDVPRKTRVTCLTQNKVIPRGESVVLAAAARGIIPDRGRVQINYDSGRSQSIAIDREGGTEKFSRQLENVQESFRYRIELNDGRTDWFRIDAQPRPSIVRVDCLQTYPDYTRQPPVNRLPGDLAILAGSRLRVTATSTKPLKSASARLLGLDRDEPMALDPADARRASVEFDVRGPQIRAFSIHLVDQADIGSVDDTNYRIDVVPDKEPRIVITWPDRREELATQQARHLIGFEAADDYGIAKILLHYKGDKDGGQEKSFELDLGGETPKSLRRRYEWNLGQISPLAPEGSSIEYWLEARDTNNVTADQGTAAFSEHYVVKIVSRDEKQADLIARLNEYLGRIDVMTQDQEKLNQLLGKLILEKSR